MKLLILGYARHGKDTVAEIMHKHSEMTYVSSSWYAAEKIIFPELGPKYNYHTPKECFDDRIHHRKEWFDLISDFNQNERTALSRLILKNHDICVGLRSRDELLAVKEQNLVDVIIWVDASLRLPPEPSTSCTVTAEDADVIISNNGTLEDLNAIVFKWLVDHVKK